MRAVILSLLLVSVAGCGWFGYGQDRPLRSERVEFDGIRFRADIDGTSEDRRDFTVSVRGASRSLAGAQQAAHFEAVKYCLGIFGGSDMEWSEDPFQDPETVVLGEKDTLTAAGRCTKR